MVTHATSIGAERQRVAVLHALGSERHILNEALYLRGRFQKIDSHGGPKAEPLTHAHALSERQRVHVFGRRDGGRPSTTERG